MHTTMANKNHTDFQIPLLSKDHSGEYHCEAINYANFIHSEPVIIAGETPRNEGSIIQTSPQQCTLMLMSNIELVAPC